MNPAIVTLREVFCVHRSGEGDAAALQGMNLELRRGELLCVQGPSGAGKSTLLRVVAGLQTPSAGIVQVLGYDIGRIQRRIRARLRHESIGFLGQHAESALSPDLRVEQAVGLPLALRGVGGRDRRGRVEELLDAASLRDRARHLTGELSGGERQRVALCAAVAHRPELLLADEPTGELDAQSAAEVRALIAHLAHADGASVLIASHDPAAADIADRAVRIRDGRVVEDRRGGQSALVIGRGGWIRLPSDLLAEVGIGERARVRAVDGGLMLEGAGWGQHVAAERAEPAPEPTATSFGQWSPARVEVRSVRRGFGRGAARRQVIEDLSLAFSPGRMTVIRGRSGAGKTTLLRMLGAIDRPEQGEVLLDSESLATRDAEQLAALRRELIGYLPQEPWPIGFMSAEENITFALRLRGWEPQAAAERAAVLLARLGLADRARQRVARLSAGEGQRVALGRALASARGLLLVDEPTSRLDESGAAAVAELLVAAAHEDGQTVICATHDPEVVRRGDEVVDLG